jgi:hypothetical protein
MHLSEAELIERLEHAKTQVEIGGTYVHYSNPQLTYTVTSVGLIEETEEPAVIYQANYAPNLIWIRPLTNWLASVEVEAGNTLPRFQKVEL